MVKVLQDSIKTSKRRCQKYMQPFLFEVFDSFVYSDYYIYICIIFIYILYN